MQKGSCMRLIFLNGWSASASLLGELPDLLSERYELIVVDHIYQYSPEEIRTKIEALLNEDTVLLAWSLGGMLALQALIEDSSLSAKLRAVIVLQTTPCFMKKADWSAGVAEEAFIDLEAEVEKQNGKKLVRLFTQLLLAGSVDPSAERKRISTHYTPSDLPSWPVLEKGLLYLRELDLRHSLEQLQLPVYGLFGANDALIKPEVMPFLGKHCVSFKGEMIPQMGHFPFGQFVGIIAHKILTFLESVPKKSDSHEYH